MSKKTTIIIGAFLIIGCTILGMGIGKLFTRLDDITQQQKPVINAAEKEALIQPDTQVIFEQLYENCQHTVISSFPDREQINGKGIKELQGAYSQANGYSMEWMNDTFVIRQIINDWCPQDKGKLRLKEYQNRVAVFQGPDAAHDVLLEVTSINMTALPDEVRKNIREGSMEFISREELNDALENLDEYL